MAVLYITEFSSILAWNGDSVQIVRQPPMAEQTVAIGAGSLQSAAFNTATHVIRLHTDSICAIEINTNPTAVPNTGGAPTARMAANQTEYFAVNPGDKVAVIASA